MQLHTAEQCSTLSIILPCYGVRIHSSRRGNAREGLAVLVAALRVCSMAVTTLYQEPVRHGRAGEGQTGVTGPALMYM